MKDFQLREPIAMTKDGEVFRYSKDYKDVENYAGGARTLQPHLVFSDDSEYVYAEKKTVKNQGWTITAAVIEDYFEWINEFTAYHEEYGRIQGDFEDIVYYDSECGLKDFLAKFPYNDWDYADI